jgi:hypothetical protein
MHINVSARIERAMLGVSFNRRTRQAGKRILGQRGDDTYNSKGEKCMNDKKLTAMETFWYYLQCLAFGAGYFAKIPVKKALSERGLATLTAAENIWYVILCLCFGLGYFQKVVSKKALSEFKS